VFARQHVFAQDSHAAPAAIEFGEISRTVNYDTSMTSVDRWMRSRKRATALEIASM
jgi:hypothetical protein